MCIYRILDSGRSEEYYIGIVFIMCDVFFLCIINILMFWSRKCGSIFTLINLLVLNH